MVGKGPNILVAGAGVFGLWQGLVLAQAGFRVRLVEESVTALAAAQSRFAGAMLSPYCEEEGAHELVRELGVAAIELWAARYPGLARKGTLVVANVRDQSELIRFGRLTSGHTKVDGHALGDLEPDLGGRFHSGLYYPDEAHMATPEALSFLLAAAVQAGCVVETGRRCDVDAETAYDAVVDCRGMGAQSQLPQLRGVRGERVVVKTGDVQLNRPVRLLHPRHPLYVVPWGGGQFMVGATVIESDDASPVTVKSALELLGLAYALHPAFGEAEIVDLGAGLRPSLPDNLPRVLVEGRVIRVNGAYRHGFLLAPILAEAVKSYLETGCDTHPLMAGHH